MVYGVEKAWMWSECRQGGSDHLIGCRALQKYQKRRTSIEYVNKRELLLIEDDVFGALELSQGLASISNHQHVSGFTSHVVIQQ